MFIDVITEPTLKTSLLSEKNIEHSTFLKTMKKGIETKVHVYFDSNSIYLITTDLLGNELDYEVRQRKLKFFNENIH